MVIIWTHFFIIDGPEYEYVLLFVGTGLGITIIEDKHFLIENVNRNEDCGIFSASIREDFEQL